MKFEDFTKEELIDVINLYIENKEKWIPTLEDFYTHYLRRCECCGEIICVDGDSELKEIEFMKNGHELTTMKCCDKCIKEIEDSE